MTEQTSQAQPPAGAAAGGDQSRLIVAIARDGDREAFAALFQYFAPRLKGYLVRSGVPSVAAEELAQETMLNVWRKASYFDPAKAGAAAWIFTIARNLRIDAARRQRNADRYGADPSDEPDEVPSADTAMTLAEREQKVREAMKSLSEEQMRVIALSFFHEKSHSQIAREIGIPLGTVKSRLRLAMGRLRELLGDI